jgi:hypothetical protein
VRPGSQIAVYTGFRIAADGKNRVIGEGGGDVVGTAILLPKVDVIAVGAFGQGATTITPAEELSADDEGDRNEVLVTVALSPIDAAKLIHAAQSDAIHLALLGEDSAQLRAGTGVDGQSMFG